VVIKANAAGGDLVIVAGLVNRFYHRLIGRSDVANAEALRGRKIGLPFLGGPQDMAVRFSLRAHGLRYGKDVKISNLGREMNRMAALTRGDIDATTSQTPPSRLAELGFRVLDDLPTRKEAFPYMMVVVRRSYLRSHRKKVRAVLLGLCRAAAYYRDNRDPSLELIKKYLHGSDTIEAARERYRSSGPSLLSWPPVPDRGGLEMVISFLGEKLSKGVKVDELLELSVLDDLRAAGECGGK
jgi:ABC-type nitrate/sulfonate/bicarbonate transport system substrate-binding protein